MKRTLAKLLEESGIKTERELCRRTKMSSAALWKIRRSGRWRSTTEERIVQAFAAIGATHDEVREALVQLHKDWNAQQATSLVARR